MRTTVQGKSVFSSHQYNQPETLRTCEERYERPPTLHSHGRKLISREISGRSIGVDYGYDRDTWQLQKSASSTNLAREDHLSIRRE